MVGIAPKDTWLWLTLAVILTIASMVAGIRTYLIETYKDTIFITLTMIALILWVITIISYHQEEEKDTRRYAP